MLSEQRKKALEKANRVRTERAHLKQEISRGRARVEPLILAPPSWLETAEVLLFFRGVRKMGRATTAEMGHQVGIAGLRTTFMELTQRQRWALVEFVRNSRRFPADGHARPAGTGRKPIVTNGRIWNDDLRTKVIQSGLSLQEIANRCGFERTDGKADGTSLAVALGLKANITRGRPSWQKSITTEQARAITEAIGLDPHEIGGNGANTAL